MIRLVCVAVCTITLLAIAVLGVLTMRKMKTTPENSEKAVAPYVSATFAAIAVFVVSAAVYLIQGM